jgi:glycosyltransferase involved in cell wall biosynthesis
MRPLRVLMVCARYLPDLGGTETHVREVTRRLSALADFEVTVLATDRTRELPEQETIDGTEVLRVPSWPSNRDYYLAPRVPGVVGRRDRWDLVHCQGVHTPVPVTAMLAARRAGIPYLMTFHTGGHSQQLRNKLRSTQWRALGPLLRDASALIGVSRFEAETMALRARLARESVMIIRNGGSLPAPSVGAVAVRGRIVSSGRLERYKGHHRIIEALPHIIGKVRDAHLIILGSGPYESELLKLAKRLGVLDRVIIKSIAPNDRRAMATALAEASVFAALSDYEAHPVAVMEALSLGRPVVGCDASGIAELIGEGWVYGVDQGASREVIGDRLVMAMSSAPLADPTELPTWDDCAEQLTQLYLTLGGRRPQPVKSEHGVVPGTSHVPRLPSSSSV